MTHSLRPPGGSALTARTAAAAVLAAALLAAGCGGGFPSAPSTGATGTGAAGTGQAASSPPPSPAATTPASATPAGAAAGSGLPCDPTAATCWIPAIKTAQFMGYQPAQHYTDARTLAAAAHCKLLTGPAFDPAKPNAHQAECTFNGEPEGTALSETWIFPSSRAEAAEAGKLAQDAYQEDIADYAVFGPGWAIGAITATVDDTQALAVQRGTGGVVMCFHGYSASNDGGC